MKTPNKLINESSPYLLQHAYNPVNWYPWSEEAFDKAAKEDKPIFLSIGYSTCHWCHVMEKESFEDEQVAVLLNASFVSIKVDREERPDIDNIYMLACQLMNGNGGWPLTIFMTHDRKPFFTGTYFPKESRYKRIGLIDLIKQINIAWKTKRNDVLNSAISITNFLQEIYGEGVAEEISDYIFEKCFKSFSNRYDKISGGFGTAPKFPSPHNLMFLMRYYKKANCNEALEMVTKTLTSMRMGGIYDQVGFGFHRYSTDSKWILPHFEKMLYDQAMLMFAYSEAFQITRNSLFQQTVEEIIEYLKRDMLSEFGGFYSAEDADSDGEEGKFYVWTVEEIVEAVEKENFDFVKILFNVEHNGNFFDEATRSSTGKNILHLVKSKEQLISDINFTPEQFDKKVNVIREKLFNYREKRIHPFKDTKILTDWNGLLIAALSIAARVFNNSEYLELAEKCVQFIFNKMFQKNGRLYHVFNNGIVSVNANLDDYAYLIWGLIELYQSTFKCHYIIEAEKISLHTIENFWDNRNSGFFFANGLDKTLLVNTKEIYDGAIPSGNSVMFYNLTRLSRITGDSKYENYANNLLKYISNKISSSPSNSTFLVSALDFLFGNSFEIIISASENDKKVTDLLCELNKHYIPNKVVILNTNTCNLPYEYLNNYTRTNQNPFIYICKNYNCQLPTEDVEKAISLLNS